MFFFVLEFLFYAALILGGVVLLLGILASDEFWNAFAVIFIVGLCGGALALAVWAGGAIEAQSCAQTLSATAGILLSSAVRILLRFKRYHRSWSVPWFTGLVVTATVAAGGAYLIWQDATALLGPAVGAFIVTALFIGFLAHRQPSRTVRAKVLTAERPNEGPHEYRYEKVP
jgi:drug/metabolite transporter (DMT)-like permease